MREIKFRLIQKGKIVGYERWNSIAGKWCYDTKPDGVFDIRNKFIPHTDKDRFTGLHDKNGKELDWWEGDVFEIHGRSTLFRIILEDGCFWFRSSITKERFPCWSTIKWSNLPEKLGDSQTIFSDDDTPEEKQ